MRYIHKIYIHNREDKNKGKSQTIKEMLIVSEIKKKSKPIKNKKLGITIIAKINKVVCQEIKLSQTHQF